MKQTEKKSLNFSSNRSLQVSSDFDSLDSILNITPINLYSIYAPVKFPQLMVYAEKKRSVSVFVSCAY